MQSRQFFTAFPPRRFGLLSALCAASLLAAEVRAADGDLDTSFDPGTGLNGTALATAVQADGKILLGGGFTTYRDAARNRIARANANGSLDVTFTPGSSATGGVVTTIAVQGDGKILIGGSFTAYNGVARARIARLNVDGSLDTSFDPGAGAAGLVSAIAVQPDGRILIGGSFQTYDGVSRNSIARLNSNGSLDASFDPGTGTGTNFRRVIAFAIQPDGRIMVGGNFDGYNGISRVGIARVNANGSLDESFNPGTGVLNGEVTGDVSAIALRGDSIVIGGFFTSYNGTPRNGIAQLTSTGALDPAFDPGSGSNNNSVAALALLSDGKLLIGGTFTSYNGVARNGIARLNVNGSVDASFDTSSGINSGGVSAIAMQPDGNIIIAGGFTTYKGVSRPRVARLLGSAGQPQPSPSPSPTPPISPSPNPNPAAQAKLWVAGRDLAANEKPDWAGEGSATNGSVPAWSYGFRSFAASTELTPFTAAQHTNSSRGRAGNLNQPSPDMQGWDPNAVVMVNTGTAPVLYDYGFGPLRPIFPGQMFMHPSDGNAFAVARWTAPAAGSYRILAKWFDLDAAGGNGASGHVVINGKEVFGRKVPADSVGPERFVGQEWDNGGNAAMPATTFRLNAGDVVDFALGSRGNFAFDSTAFNAAIRLVPTVTLTEPSSERIAVEGSDLPIRAEVSSERPVDFVRFELNGKRVRRDRTPPYEYTIQDLAAGTYYLTAVARDETGVDVVSEPVKLTVLRVPSEATTQARKGSAKDPGDSTRASAAKAGGRTYYCTQSGSWQNPATWGGEGVPGINDDAVIPAGFSVITEGSSSFRGTEVNNLEVAGSLTIGSPNSIRIVTVYGVLQLSGQVNGGTEGSQLIVEVSGKLSCVAGQAFLNQIVLINVGDLVVTGKGGIGSSRSSINTTGSANLFPPPGTNRPVVATFNKIQIAGGQVVLGPWTQLVAAGAGNLIGQDGGSLIGQDGSTLIGQDGSTLIGQDGSTLIGQDGSTLRGPDGNRLIGLDGSTLIGQDGSTLIGQDGGSLVGHDGSSFKKEAAAHGKNGERTSSREALGNLGGIFFRRGHLGGILNLIGNVRNEGAFMSPGSSPGKMRVFGDYTQESAGTLMLEVGGTQTDPLQFDQLEIGGTANLGGKLIVNAIDGFTPQSGDVFAPLTYSAVNGNFENVSSNAQISFGAEGMTMQVSGANPPPPKALNIATRMRVETGDNVLIAGFIVTGSQPKRVLIRGIGPSLPVSGALADPTLDLDGGAFFNDDWRSDQRGEIEGTTIPPSSELESAIVATLEPGAHTAVLRGKNDGTGVGLVEVYDLESGTPAQLANISTRGQVQTGDNVMIGGFIIGGDYPARVLLRAIGPSLPVDGNLQDPTLELVDSQGNTISNDNWRETQEAEIIASTVPPPDDNEAAIVATLVPGAYTAVVRGKDEAVGVALVEGYNLQ